VEEIDLSKFKEGRRRSTWKVLLGGVTQKLLKSISFLWITYRKMHLLRYSSLMYLPVHRAPHSLNMNFSMVTTRSWLYEQLLDLTP